MAFFEAPSRPRRWVARISDAGAELVGPPGLWASIKVPQPEQEDKAGSPIDRAVRTRRVFRRNNFAIHLFSPSLSYLQASLCQSGVPNPHPDVISIQTTFPIRQGSCQTSRVLNLLSSESKWLMHNHASGVKPPGCGHCRVFGQQCSKACGQNVVLRLPYRAGSATRSLYTSRSLLPFTGFASRSGQARLR